MTAPPLPRPDASQPPAAAGAHAPAGAMRFVVFTGNLSESVRNGVLELHRAFAGSSWLIVLHSPRKTAGGLLKSQSLNLRRNGWRWVPYQAADATRVLFAKSRRHHDGAGAPLAREWPEFLALPSVTLTRTDDIHAPPTLRQVEAFGPDLGLSLAAPILKRALFAIPRLGTLNLHKGRLPDYRGMPPAFWELWNDENSVGCSVHWVDDKLDTGHVQRAGEIRRDKYSTLRGLQMQLDQLGIALMRDAVSDVLAGRITPVPQPAGGKTYRKPTLGQVAQLQRRLDALQPPGQAPIVRIARNGMGALALCADKAGLSRWLKPRITVLLYHRVADDARDNLTTGVEQFERQMALLRRHCEVLSLHDVLAARVVPKSSRPLVAVTFDDGYLDNYLHAAPSLLKYSVPAAFFVSTGLIDTNGRFPHDIRRGNPPLPTMTWQQLREMRDQGFTIGSHSVTHIDCAAEPAEKVKAELQRSLEDMRVQLGVSDPVFAYPYGGRQHMTAERLEWVKDAGYVGCLSAFGGSNIGSVDRFNVVRRGIHWEFSDQAFMLECLGIR
jgi:peptidoglycan/xylan/chitin deacetylase (PgdA/CDA1 family)